MGITFNEFQPISKEDWVQLIHKELKGDSADLLVKTNSIENISFSALWHKSDAVLHTSQLGFSTYARGYASANSESSNDWFISAPFLIGDSVETNQLILNALMNGVTALYLIAKTEEKIDFPKVLDQVGLAFIQTAFQAKTSNQAKDFLTFLENQDGYVVNLPFEESIAKITKNKKVKPFTVSGYNVQQSGANCVQEIAAALSEGHELLVKQIDSGISVDEAAGNIHFLLGIGTQYFYEIAKIRAFRTLWSAIVKEYNPEHACSLAATITSKTGFTHVTLNDPHTNLLRQTTQVMSAAIGGAQAILNMPYNWFQENAKLTETARQAINISLVLKEESYLNHVLDTSAGSYFLDQLHDQISDKTWELFQEIENLGGIETEHSREYLCNIIRKTAKNRIDLIHTKDAKLIGLNIFPNPVKTEAKWTVLPAGWNNLPRLILEA